MPIKERVTRVIDGDTFMTDKRKRAVRLANVDAPEKGERGAVAATRRLTAMVAGKEVTVMPVARDLTLPRLGGRPGKVYQAALAILTNA